MPSDGSAHRITQRLLAELTGRGPDTRYPPAARLGADLGLDSLRQLFLVTRIEEETGTPVGGEAGLAALRTAGDVEQFVARCLATAAAQDRPATEPATEPEPKLEARIEELVREIAGDRLSGPIEAATPLASLGLDSQSLVALFALVERRLGVQFDLDTPSSCFVSIAALAEHLRATPALARGDR